MNTSRGIDELIYKGEPDRYLRAFGISLFGLGLVAASVLIFSGADLSNFAGGDQPSYGFGVMFLVFGVTCLGIGYTLWRPFGSTSSVRGAITAREYERDADGGEHYISIKENRFKVDSVRYEALGIGDAVTIEVWDRWYWKLCMGPLKSITRHSPKRGTPT